MENTEYYLENIHFSRHESGRLAPDLLYAILKDKDGGLVISATLDYILKKAQERGWKIKGVTISKDRWGDTRFDISGI